CALLSGGLLWFLAGLTSPWAVFGISLAFWLVMGPVFTLGTALSFTHLAHPEREYGPVRMWGTVGWVVPCWLLAYWFEDPDWLHPGLPCLRPNPPASELGDAFRLGGLLAFLLGFYTLTLPHTPPQRQRGARPAPLAALQLLRSRDFLVYCVCNWG